MRKKRNQQKNTDQFDGSDDDTLSSTSTAFSDMSIGNVTEHMTSLDDDLERFLDALYEKRGSTREMALSALVGAFEGHVLLKFAENKCITLLHQYINSVKRGSTKEACLACHAIGLLAITVGAGSSAHEIVEETIPKLSPTLHSGSDSVKRSSLIECIAVCAFVGANDLDETEKAMEVLWEVIHPKARTDAGPVKKPPPAVIAAALSAWSFVLTTISDFRMNHDNWHESLRFLSTLLQKDDRAIRMAAGEAIALIFEIGRLDKFSRDESEMYTIDDEAPKTRGFTYIESLKGKILNQVRDLAMEAGGKGATKKDLNSQRDLFQDVLDFLETGDCPEISVRISNKWGILTVSTWAQSIQLNFLKRYLGKGFLKHMQDNELLHDVFDFTPGKKGNFSAKEKRMFLSPNSAVNKERTQMRNKYRTWAQSRNEGHFAVVEEDA